MRFYALSLALAVVAAVALDEDETNIISSPYHKHADSFAENFKQLLASRPTGRPRDVYAAVKQKYMEASKALSAARPTGRPFRSHQDRAQQNHATWSLHRGYTKSMTALRKYYSQLNKQARLNKSWNNYGDETEILSSPFAGHVNTFRQQLSDLLANRPTGRPVFEKYEQMLSDNYKKAREIFKAGKPSEDATNEERKAYKQARDDLTAQKEEMEDKLEEWEDQLDEQDVLNSQFGDHIMNFKDHLSQQLLASRPTGRPGLKGMMKDLEKKYKEIRDQMKAYKPGKDATDDEEDLYDDAEDLLEDHFEDAEKKVKSWAKALKAQRGETEDQDETEVISPYHKHANSFAENFKQLLASRPTGRPRDIYAAVKQKYMEASKALSAARPTGSPFRSHQDRAQHNHATWSLHRGYTKSMTALRKYYSQLNKQARLNKSWNNYGDETEILSSPFAGHVNTFRQHFSDLFANRPTGRPSFVKYEQMLSDNYKKAKETIKAGKPSEDATDEERKAYKQARDDLKDHKEEFEDKLEEWEDQLDEQDVLNSRFGEHIMNFKDHLSQQLLASRPTGRPGLKGMMKDLEKKYKEIRDQMKAYKPGKDATDDEEDLYDDAKDLLEDHYEDAEEKVKSWAKALKAQREKNTEDQDETEVISSPFSSLSDTFRQHFDDMFANRPTGRPDFEGYERILKQKYNEAKAFLKFVKPKKSDKEQKKSYADAHHQLKQHKNDIEDQLDQWEQEDKKQAVLQSEFGQHVGGFRDHFNDVFEARPTGRPEMRDFFKDLRQKYNEYKKSLGSANPGKQASSEHKGLFRDASSQLRGHWNDAEDKVKAWASQLKKQQRQQKAALKTAANSAQQD